MIQNIKRTTAFFAPAPVIRALAAGRFKAMRELIAELDIDKDMMGLDCGSGLRAIRLSSRVELIGHLPNSIERKVCGSATSAQGLDVSYTKVLIDAITRYQYPHFATPFQRIVYPKRQRGFFHPQHGNLVAEDDKFSVKDKQRIGEIFKPKSGWFVLDIGAYLGHGSLALRPLIGSTGTIVSVEASIENYEVLEEHIARNEAENIIPLNAAIWRKSDGSVRFQSTKRQANAVDSDVVKGDAVTEVATTSLGELTDRLGRAADLVSLTVNGAEVEAIEGLFDMPTELRPDRIMAPGWYLLNGKPRAEILKSYLDQLDYEVATTSGNFVLAWRRALC